MTRPDPAGSWSLGRGTMVETTTSGVQRAIRSVTHRLTGETPELPVEGQPGGVRRRDRLAQFGAADSGGPPRARRPRRLLDVHLHQLAAHPALPARMAREVRGPGRDGDRRPHAGVRVRAERRQHRPAGAGVQGRLSDRDRQRLRRLAGVRQPLLAGPVHRRRRGTDPLPPLRRGRVRHVRDGRPAAAPRGRCRGLRSGARRRWTRRASRSRPTGGPWDRPRRTSATAGVQRFRVAGSRAVQRAAQLSGAVAPRPQRVGADRARGRSRSTLPCSTSPADGSRSASRPATSTW